MAGLCAAAQGSNASRPYPTFALAMTAFDDPSWDVLSPERPLRFWRLLEVTASPSQPLTAGVLRADERIVNFAKGLNHLDEFSVIESWSGYFHPTDPTGTRALDRGGQAVVHSLIPQLRPEVERLPSFIGFYVGSGDDRFRDENQQLDRELRAAGVVHTFAVYPGAHMTSLWQRHATAWLRLALNRLVKPA